MNFADFTHRRTPVSSGAHIASYYRRSSHGRADSLPILVLLHGYPQNNLMWKNFVEEIPPEWTIFVPDLPGYGESTKEPSSSGDSLAHSKREWAKDIIEALDITHGPVVAGSSPKVIAYGHDRGARLAYRLSLDFPERIAGVGVLDIVPTSFVWGAMNIENAHRETKSSWHWVFLSAPRPFPETLISAQPEWFYTDLMQRWGGKPSDWVADSVKPYLDPSRGKERIIGSCEDYRAGSTHDIKHDLEAGVDPSKPERVFKVPVLALSSVHLRRRFPVDEIWRSLAPEGLAESFQIGGDGTGHFLVNEAQSEVGQRTREWLKQNWGT